MTAPDPTPSTPDGATAGDPMGGDRDNADAPTMLSVATALAFEKHWEQTQGDKDEAIRQQFGVSPAAYYYTLLRFVRRPEFAAAEPLLAERLQRIATGSAA